MEMVLESSGCGDNDCGHGTVELANVCANVGASVNDLATKSVGALVVSEESLSLDGDLSCELASRGNGEDLHRRAPAGVVDDGLDRGNEKCDSLAGARPGPS